MLLNSFQGNKQKYFILILDNEGSICIHKILLVIKTFLSIFSGFLIVVTRSLLGQNFGIF